MTILGISAKAMVLSKKVNLSKIAFRLFLSVTYTIRVVDAKYGENRQPQEPHDDDGLAVMEI